MGLWLIIGLSAAVFGGGCAILASNKNRDVFGWFVLGFFFNLVALIVIAALSPLEATGTGERSANNAPRDTSVTGEALRLKAAELKNALAQTRTKLDG